MAVLECSKHEQFALFVAKGLSATKAYVSAGYSPNGAQQSAARMLTNAKVRSRIRELRETLSAATIALEISSRNSRVAALQKRWDRLRSSLELLLDERGKDMADVPGGASGLLCRDWKGKLADKEVSRIDPGVVAVVAELRNHEKQAAQELGQWTEEQAPEAGDTLVNEITIVFVDAPNNARAMPQLLAPPRPPHGTL
jgi:Terminase small subunit